MRIGVDVGGTKIEVISLSDQGEELFRKRLPTPKQDYTALLQVIKTLVDEAEETLGETGTVGMGIPGSISKNTGLVKNANTQCLIGKPMQKDMEALLNREVRWSNDANCMAVSEAVDGAAAGHDVVLALILGTGCGSGIALFGQAHNGRNLVAGEVGHISLPWMKKEEREESDLCYCGHKGCVETWVSGTGFERDYERHSGNNLKGPDIVARAEAGEDAALKAFERYENRLARVCAHCINLIDPDIIVFAGGMSNNKRLYSNVPVQLKRYVFGSECDTPIVPAKHGDSSGVRGAAWLWPLKK
jgi:fructokinase